MFARFSYKEHISDLGEESMVVMADGMQIMCFEEFGWGRELWEWMWQIRPVLPSVGTMAGKREIRQ